MKEVLDAFQRRYDRPQYLSSDPLSLVHNHSSQAPEDREAIAFLCAFFSYGRVRSIQDFLNDLLSTLGKHPAQTLRLMSRCEAAMKEPAAAHEMALAETRGKDRKSNSAGEKSGKTNATGAAATGASAKRKGGSANKGQSSLYYRFQSSRDLKLILMRLGHMMRKDPVSATNHLRMLPLERHFGEPSLPVEQRIQHFQRTFLSQIREEDRSPGILHWIGQPESRGARKRFCMFLRWMVRKEYPDLGLYRSFRTEDLIVPLDVHMGRIARNLSLSQRKTVDWVMATEVSAALRRIKPEDPTAYDFSLTRPGILGRCSGVYQDSVCPGCGLHDICIQTAHVRS